MLVGFILERPVSSIAHDLREVDAELRSLAQLAVYVNRSAVHCYDPLNNRQTQSCSFTEGLCRKEWFEESVLNLRGNSGAVVTDGESDNSGGVIKWTCRQRTNCQFRSICIDQFDTNLDRARLTANRLRGVRDEVDDNLLNLCFVSQYPRRFRCTVNYQ